MANLNEEEKKEGVKANPAQMSFFPLLEGAIQLSLGGTCGPSVFFCKTKPPRRGGLDAIKLLLYQLFFRKFQDFSGRGLIKLFCPILFCSFSFRQ
jgi:hypothetical protein